MNVFVTEEFLSELKSISKKKSHSGCESDLIESIFNKRIDEVKTIGTKRLGGQPDKSPFLRKRIGAENSGKSSGYRLYFWLFIQKENVFLLFIHPKSGRRSATNLSAKKQKDLVRTFKECRDKNLFSEIAPDETKSHLIFTKTKKRILK